MSYKICVYAISKNEEVFIDRWMDAVGEADLVVVTDTGSTDGTVERLRARGAVVYEEKIDPWRFDTARNIALEHLPQDTDICVSNDVDEVFEPGWREQLEANWRPGHTRARYHFVWSHRPDGAAEKSFIMEKIHRRHDFRWVHPVHEVLEYSGKDPDSSVFIDGITLHHMPDPHKSRGRYLPLLELSAEENPHDDRTMFWLGREYVYNGLNDKAIETLKRHLKLPAARWDEERSASMRYISQAYLGKGDVIEAKSWLFKSVAECQRIREPWLALARLGYEQGDWPLVFFAADKALCIKVSTNSYLIEPAAWAGTPDDLAAIACYHLGMYERALLHAQNALEFAQQDARLERNLELIKARLGEA